MHNLHGLYVITDPILCSNDLISKVELAILGGAQVIQYRNKNESITKAQQQTEAAALQSLCTQHGRTFIINDDVPLAIKINADGVHLGQTDGDITSARKRLGDNKIIGITCHSDLNAAISAQQQTADYVAFGRFYPSKTKPAAPPADIDILLHAKSQLQIPIVAIGGISVENATTLIQAGADMLAVIHAVFGQDNIKQAADEFKKLF